MKKISERNKQRAEAFMSLQQYHMQIITIISLAGASSKQTVNRDILVMACQSFSVNDSVHYPIREHINQREK